MNLKDYDFKYNEHCNLRRSKLVLEQTYFGVLSSVLHLQEKPFLKYRTKGF